MNIKKKNHILYFFVANLFVFLAANLEWRKFVKWFHDVLDIQMLVLKFSLF